jgi:hypothetical protein
MNDVRSVVSNSAKTAVAAMFAAGAPLWLLVVTIGLATAGAIAWFGPDVVWKWQNVRNGQRPSGAPTTHVRPRTSRKPRPGRVGRRPRKSSR